MTVRDVSLEGEEEFTVGMIWKINVDYGYISLST